jgi:hypothetical protein
MERVAFTTPQVEEATQGKLSTTEVAIVAAAAERSLAGLKGLTPRFRRLALERALCHSSVQPEPIQEDAEQEKHAPRLQLNKACEELVPLVQFLTNCTFREKLVGVAMDLLSYNDVSDALGPKEGQVYDGDIGEDLRHDWEDEIFDAVGKEVGTPEERVLAAYLAGLSAVR